MYETFYGFRDRPFELVSNTKFLFLTARQREALSTLQYGLTTAHGLTLLLGEAGTGKTTLIQAAVAGLKEGAVQYVLVSNPTLTRSEFYEFLAKAFGLGPEAARSKTRFLFELRRLLLDRQAAGMLSALILDEAQSIPYELLEEIRLLSNMETPTAKLLNVVLAGQPELANRLNEISLRQLKQRISLRCELQPMTLVETASYIAGRLRIAGGRPELVFTREAIAAIYKASGGLPRMINVICDNALVGGFAAQVKPLSAAFVADVCRDFDYASSAAASPSLTDLESHEEAPVNRPHLVSGPAPLPAADAAPTERESNAPLFGEFNRKRRFSFF